MQLNVLSGGAVQRGLESAAEIFEKQTGHEIAITFATAPVIRRKIENEENSRDVVVAPVPAMEDFAKSSRIVIGSTVVVGSVKAGIVVRQDAPEPDISTAETLKKEILASQSLVYNEGSSGIFVDKLLEQLGVADQVKAKITRYPDAEGVMKHLANSRTDREIGFGQITAILLHAGLGIKLVGPLPNELENITTYAAGVSTRATAPELSLRFVRFLTTPTARRSFKAAGVDPAI